MKYEKLWMAADAVREKAVEGAQKISKTAGETVETVRSGIENYAEERPYRKYCASAAYLRQRIGDFTPEVLMILGSGLGFMGEEVEEPVFVDYGDIPSFKHSTAPGHKGRFVFGRLCGKNVAIMQGRMHTYEGYSMEEVSYAVRVLHLLGARTMIVTNAAGAIREEYEAGDIMLISDHIKMFAGSPLTGPNVEEFGVRFPDMSHAYSPRLRALAKDRARALDIPLREGVYMFFPGPQFETPAEIRAARVLGADAAGMSTVPEVIVANHCGMEVLGLTLCANMAAGILDQPLTEEEVLEAAEGAREHFSALVRACLEKM